MCICAEVKRCRGADREVLSRIRGADVEMLSGMLGWCR
jgi:hypothetical protein